MKHNKAVKNRGEREAGIDIQMRFVPLKTDTSDSGDAKETEVYIKRNQKERSGGQNDLKVKVPMITNLNGAGEQFIINIMALQNSIFSPMGWTDQNSISERLDLMTKFLDTMAMNTFTTTLESVRMDFLKYANGDDAAEDPECQRISKNEKLFITWIKTHVVELGYLEEHEAINPEWLEKARAKGLLEYERSILWTLGKALWTNHYEAFHMHLRYFLNQIVKPFDMSVLQYIHAMNLYAMKLKMMQPSSNKTERDPLKADWEGQQKAVSPLIIREAIFYGLPASYQVELRSNHEEDWRYMPESMFVQRAVDHEVKDKASQKIKKADADKAKAEKKRSRESGSDKGRKRGRRSDKSNQNGDDEKKHCTKCFKAKRRYFWNHDTDQCTFKENQKERNDLEAVQAENKELRKELNSATKIMKKLNKKLESDSDESSD